MFDARPNLANTSGAYSWADKAQLPSNSGGGVNNSGVVVDGTQEGFISRLKNTINMERLQGLRSERLNKIRSWKSEFFNREQFSLPDGWSTAQNRLSNNVGYFQSNYLIVFLLLLCYCL